MPKIIADFHVHSAYSSDFTHPAHLRELKEKLKPAGNGLYTTSPVSSVFFIPTAEISSIYTCKGKVRKVHSLVIAPGIEIAEKINNTLQKHGNLSSDGRPILGLSAKELLKIVLDTSEDCLFVPAHAWTPWFSVFGSKSGFDSLEECFDEYAEHIHAIETGLSSDPQMNWRLSSLDNITLLSNSDAHSPGKLGREANVFDCEMDYYAIIDTIKKKDRTRFLFTIEFFPEEGKYHFDGHRACNVLFSPRETRKHDAVCPVCNKNLTVGVMSRIEELADREPDFVPQNAIPAKHLVPLQEILSRTLNCGVNTKKVTREYDRLVSDHTEFEILIDLSEPDLFKITAPNFAENILKVRRGEIDITPGYDGVFGSISISS
jgi:uncharacterized protein (TIGR00375 family)